MVSTERPDPNPVLRDLPLHEGTMAEHRFRVLVAGGGVAALEAVLALHDLNDGSVDVQLLCPDSSFRIRALSVAQPFGSEAPRELDLEAFCRAHGVTLLKGAVAEVWGEQQRVLTDDGDEHFYDALLLAIGARQRDALPGGHPFRGTPDVDWFAGLLEEVEQGAVRHVTFAVPGPVRWSLPLYELALLTAHRLRETGHGDVELTFVTPEPSPLEVFGHAASERIAELLAEAGVELIRERVPVSFDGETLRCGDGSLIDTGRVVTMPELYVPAIPGVPQGRRGFIGCDPQMRVDGLRAVWVAGDASWLPIKQGGLAAQQAEVAAANIAVLAAIGTETQTFRPVIRGALLTGSGPQFLRVEIEADAEGDLSASPMWWPPIKVAAPRLAPYLAAEWDGEPREPLGELEDLDTDAPEWQVEGEHREALRLALSYADVDAREGDIHNALRWLDVAERLNVTLPLEYVDRREEWRRRAEEDLQRAGREGVTP